MRSDSVARVLPISQNESSSDWSKGILPKLLNAHTTLLGNIFYNEPSSRLLLDWSKRILPRPLNARTTSLCNTSNLELLLEGKTVIVVLSKDNLSRAVHATSNHSIDVAKQLDLIKECLALSITQLADLFGVTRKTIYDWYEKSEPRYSTLNKIQVLIEVLNKYSSKIDLTRLKAVWNIPVSGSSFLMVFSDNNADPLIFQKTVEGKLNELSTRLKSPANSTRKTIAYYGDAHIAEFDRRIDHE